MNDKQEASGPLRIFLSHKEIDLQAARLIAGALRIGGAQVCYSGERRQFGRDFREWIKENLERAEWYILAYTEPAKNWDWCLYEAGYFEACKGSESSRVICLHPDEEIPEPLKAFDSISINNESSLLSFCEQFFRRVNPALSADEITSARKKLSEDITGAFRDRIENRYYCQHITLTIPAPRSLGPNDLPDNARVGGSEEMLRNLFTTTRQDLEWSQLRNSPATRDKRWVTQLVHALKDIAEGRVLQQPITGTIEGPDAQQSFLPVLYRVDELENHSYECEILLAEGITSRWAALRDVRFRALVTSLRMAVRFRYDVIEQFRGRVLQTSIRLGPKRFREHFRNLMFDIMTESEALGLTLRELVTDCFDSEEARAEIATLFDQWEKDLYPRLFTAFGMSPDPSVWTKFDDGALEANEIQEIERCLVQLRDINTRFVSLGLLRFQNLLVSGEA